MLRIWHERYQKPYGWFGLLLILIGMIRLLIMLFPENEWNEAVPPQPWSLYRNVPLTLQGLGVAYLILRDAQQTKDTNFYWIGVLILFSFAMYAPVVLFVQRMPLLGLFMIPKTIAYVAIGFTGYKELFPS